MEYLKILGIIFAIIWLIFFAALFHYLFFTIAGIFVCKKFLKTEEKLKYGIIIGARNEESVIGSLIESIQANDYPQDKIQIFVVRITVRMRLLASRAKRGQRSTNIIILRRERWATLIVISFQKFKRITG